MSAVSTLTNFFQSMFNRMVGRALSQNPDKSGHIGSAPDQSGNLGAGAIPIGNIAVYPDPKSIAYIRDGYGGNSTIFTIIKAIAAKFAYLPRYVYEIKDPLAVRQYKHFVKTMDPKSFGNMKTAKKLYYKAYQETVVTNGLSQLLVRPNPMEGQDFFFEKVATYYETEGEAIIWCNRGLDAEDLPIIEGEILEMWCLPPEYLEMVPDPLNVWGCLGWVLNVAGKRIPIDAENIIHWRTPNLEFDGVTRSHMRGFSPMKPARKVIQDDESAVDASVSLSQNGGAKGIAFDKSGTPMTPTRETQIRGAIDKKVNGNDHRGLVAFVSGDIGYVSTAMTAEEMQLEVKKQNIFNRLCNVWQIPPDLFNSNTTFQNMIQARKDFVTNKVLPMACRFRDELNRVLLPAFNLSDKNYTTDIDVTQIQELQDDMTALVNALVAAWWMTPAERRAEQNLEEHEEDGMDDIWIPTTLVKMADAGAPMDAMGVDSFGNLIPGKKPNTNGGGKDKGSTDKGNTNT